MTRSVEIPEAATSAAVNATKGTWTLFETCPELAREVTEAVLAAALPYLAPAAVCSCPPHANPEYSSPGDWDPKCPVHQPVGDGGLREALGQELKNLPVMSYDDGYRAQALPKATLLDLLAAHPAAPAVPQPARYQLMDAMRAVLGSPECHCDLSGKTDTLKHYGHMADAVLAVLAGEQEQARG